MPLDVPEELADDEEARSAFREVGRRFRDEAAQIYIVVAIALQSFYAFATNLDAREKRKS
jgi:hypothetical protein|tara:strand:+ start:133 stop:312 length:180 start_codon:yes stop_codon:yes gene_type:complete